MAEKTQDVVGNRSKKDIERFEKAVDAAAKSGPLPAKPAKADLRPIGKSS